MKKGFETSIYMVGAVLLAIIAGAIVLSALYGKAPPVDQNSKPFSSGCNNEGNCIDDLDGSKCLMVYSEGLTPFCGCLVNDDCLSKRSGICGSNEKCV